MTIDLCKDSASCKGVGSGIETSVGALCTLNIMFYNETVKRFSIHKVHSHVDVHEMCWEDSRLFHSLLQIQLFVTVAAQYSETRKTDINAWFPNFYNVDFYSTPAL